MSTTGASVVTGDRLGYRADLERDRHAQVLFGEQGDVDLRLREAGRFDRNLVGAGCETDETEVARRRPCVVICVAPVAVLTNWTVALGMPAPDGSCTTPWTLAVNCAKAAGSDHEKDGRQQPQKRDGMLRCMVPSQASRFAREAQVGD